MHSRSRKAEKEPHVTQTQLDFQERKNKQRSTEKRRTKEKPDHTERHDEDKGERQTKG